MGKIIEVSNLSKVYRLGLKEEKVDSLSKKIIQAVTAPIRNFSNIRKLGDSITSQSSLFHALSQVNFSVSQGQVLGIIGRNGAGKSTLLKILSSITEPTSGTIKIQGRVASLLEVGTGFHPELSGRDNIYMNGTILGMTRKEIDQRLDEIVDFSGIEKFLDTAVKFYSSGMKVRLGFAVAAHLEPEILIIDEVLAVGDFEFQRKCLSKMENVSKNEGRTVIFVSHQLDAVKALCPQTLFLENGKVKNLGETQSILEEYLGAKSINYSQEFELVPETPSIVFVEIDQNKLKNDILQISVDFVSPYVIDNPIVGFVLYSRDGNPILGSNPRFHSSGFQSEATKSGRLQASLSHLELHSGIYRISVWLGNGFYDLDSKEEALTFEFISKKAYTQLPPSSVIGSIDKAVDWNFIKN